MDSFIVLRHASTASDGIFDTVGISGSILGFSGKGILGKSFLEVSDIGIAT